MDADDRPSVPLRSRESAGAFARPLQRLVRALIEAPATIPALVAATGNPRREVEQALAAFGDDLERRGDVYALRGDRVEVYTEDFDLAGLAARGLDDVVGSGLARQAELVRFVQGLNARRPRPSRDLDHVAATAETVVRRALWLDANYDLRGRDVLCVGDHDLTSIAVAACIPGVRVTVADVDERVLEFIDGVAREEGWQVRCLWGDFRLGLPASAVAVGEIAVTDPPYTPEGVATFVVAALEGLADRERGRIVMAYGYGEHQPALGLKVQQAVMDMQIAFEAILPAFNSYEGAQAIGSRSDLYVCRPTARTWRALPTLSERQGMRIYTHGAASLESSAAPRAQTLSTAVAELAGAPDVRLALLVGDGWQALPGSGGGSGGGPGGPGGGPEQAASLIRSAQRATVATVLGKGVPQQVSRRDDLGVLLDLAEAPVTWVRRALLAVNAARVVAVVPIGSWQPDDSELVREKYAVSVGRTPDGGHDLIVAVRAPGGPSVARAVLGKVHGKLGNAWREALIAHARRAGVTLTKNEARDLIRQSCSVPDVLDLHLIELPGHLLNRVVAEVRASELLIASWPASSASPEPGPRPPRD